MNEDHSTHRIPGIAYNCGGIFFSILSVFKLTLVQIAVLKLFYALEILSYAENAGIVSFSKRERSKVGGLPCVTIRFF